MRARQWMQVTAVAAAIGLSGTAVAHGTDRMSSSSDTSNAATSTSDTSNAAASSSDTNSSVNDNAAAQMDSVPSSSGTSGAPVLNGSTSSDTSAAATLNPSGTTQGSTMTSPRSEVTSRGTDRLGTTNSENFNQWMSDYAAQHDGQITRQQFLDEMGDRWDAIDRQRQGSLTPGEVREIFIFQETAPARTGSDAQAGDMGPASTRAQ